MPWHPCVNKRDTIIADEGYAVNFYELDDQQTFSSVSVNQSPWTVTSHCRVTDGTWVGMVNKTAGVDKTDTGDPILSFGDIFDTSFAQVVFFADDGSPPLAFDLDIWVCFTWDSDGRYSRMDADGRTCSIRPLISDLYFAPNTKSELVSWFSGALEVQVRSDGTNVWAAVLAQESTEYLWLSQKQRVDACGFRHTSILVDYESGSFDREEAMHDTTPVRLSGLDVDTWWSQSNVVGGDQDDQGVNNSFRWQPARLTVFSGGTGGFTKIDTVYAKFGNCYGYGLIGHLEACASPAEPGVLHVMWSEGGFARSLIPFDSPATISWDGQNGIVGQRINYSRWSATAKLVDNDVALSIDGTTAVGHNASSFPGEWVWTDEYVLRNDHGSCAAFIWSWATDPDPDVTRASGPLHLDPNAFAYYDMSSGAPVFVQLLDTSLIPTPAETGVASIVPVGTLNLSASTPITDRPDVIGHSGRSHFASSLYTDSTLTGTDVYILGLNFSTDGAPSPDLSAFYRIPVDGSDTFTFLDGVRLMQFSIIVPVAGGPVAQSDFVSDPGNVWIPALYSRFGVAGGGVWHLVRTCERTWELLQGFPLGTLPLSGNNLAGAWAQFAPQVLALNSPPSLVTDDSGNDWLAAGGVVPPGQSSGNFPFYAAALRARICRCCVPCIERIGMHIWEQH